ncbi:hypothetical protein TeGR_g6866, partial [Tetraparma gracilis]
QLKGSALSCGLGSGVALGCSSSPPSTWPDRDHGLVCGDCKVLVNQFGAKYGGTCDGYCGSMGMQCTGAWDEGDDTCTEMGTLACNEMLDSSDAICECKEPEQECEVCAAGMYSGEVGNEPYDEDSPAHASLTASVVIPYAGDWTLDVTQGTYNVQHFLGSPQLITVAAAATDPDSCVVKIPGGRSITARSSFEAIVETFDEFENPTSHPEDSFKSRVELGNSEENFDNRHVLPPDHAFSELQTLYAAAELAKVNLEMEGQGQRFTMQKKALEAEKEELEEEVRLKKHSEEELKVMVSALEAVSKERQDELKEVMMESKELKIDKMLGKGGFGVVNLATYRGTKVAMKQLLTVNEENVLRFRHECFLTKNLSHPNVVKLVGVCWSEDLFACCLEFVENGSLEFWLRLTAGGKKWVAAKKPVVGKNKKKQKKKRPPLSEVTFKGFDHNGEYNSAEHTDTDRAKKAEVEQLVHDWWMQRMNPKMGWTEMLKEDKSRLDHGFSAYNMYYYSEGWRPILPLAFVKAYPKLHALIQECWRVRRKERPNFDQIVSRLQGDIGDEIKRKEEPKIELYSKENDEIYRGRIGKEDEIEDSDEEESGTKRGEVVSKAAHKKVVEAKDKAMAAKDKAMAELQAKMGKVENALEEKAAEAGRWGAALQEVKSKTEQQEEEKLRWGAVLAQLKVETPEDLQKLVDDNNLTNEPRV